MKKLIALLLFSNCVLGQITKDSANFVGYNFSSRVYKYILPDSLKPESKGEFRLIQAPERELVKHITCGDLEIFLYSDGWEVQYPPVNKPEYFFEEKIQLQLSK